MESNLQSAEGESSSQEDNYQCSQKHLLGTGSLSQELLLLEPEDYDSQEMNTLFDGIQADPVFLAGERDNAGYNNPILGTDPIFENIPPSQGGLSQLSFGIPVEVGRDDSFGVFGNNSFDFSNMGDEMVLLSQLNGSDGFVLVNNETPPLSVSGSENGIDHHGNAQNGLPDIKYEIGTELEYPRELHLSQHVNCVENNDDGAAADSSQDESQGGRLPVLKCFPGKYSFRVVPVDKAAKKCILDPEINKIFCLDKIPILFRITLDFATAPLKKLSIQAVIYYTSNSMISRNVERCQNCIDTEEKNPLTPTLHPIGADFENHIIRSDNERAEYFKKRGSHYCVSTPLEKLQAGVDRFLRNYTFMCMNSCHRKKGRDTRTWSLVFYLMENDREVGREVYDLKVCKCPTRDCRTERKRRREMFRGPTQTVISPNTEPTVGVDGLQPSPAKLARQSRELDVADARRSAEEPRPGPSRLAQGRPSSTAVRPEPKQRKDSQDTDSQGDSFSQDDPQISGENIRRLSRYYKLAAAHKRHPNREYNRFTKNWLKTLKCHMDSFHYYKTYVVKEGDLPEEEEEQNEDEGEGGSQD